jgi:dTDP-4-dehydrorhamnose reductase
VPQEPGILVVGRSGRLAQSIVAEAARLGLTLRSLGRPELDIDDPDSIARVLRAESPRAIVNAAGLVDVDEAEKHPDRAFALNRDGAARLAEAAARAQIPFLQVSSDYVFDGRKTTPYVESDATGPLNVYGRSKVAGEVAVLTAYPSAIVVRTSWVFTPFGKSFITAMLALARTHETVRVVADQTGTPTSGAELAKAMLDMTVRMLRDGTQSGGIYHLASSGETTWFGFAQAIFDGWARLGHRVPLLQPMTRSEWGLAARPRYSSLDCEKIERTFGIRLPPWQPALQECLDQMLRADAGFGRGSL